MRRLFCWRDLMGTSGWCGAWGKESVVDLEGDCGHTEGGAPMVKEAPGVRCGGIRVTLGEAWMQQGLHGASRDWP